MHLNQWKKNGNPTCFAEHAVNSTFLDTQESFQEAKMKDVCRVIFEESCVREEVAHT